MAAAGAQGPAHPVIRPTHRLGTNRPAPALQAADGVLRDVMQGLLQLAHKVPEPGQPLQPAAGAVARGGAAVVGGAQVLQRQPGGEGVDLLAHGDVVAAVGHFRREDLHLQVEFRLAGDPDTEAAQPDLAAEVDMAVGLRPAGCGVEMSEERGIAVAEFDALAVVAAEPQVIGRFLEQGWARGLRRVLRHGVRYAGARRAWSQGEVPPLGPDPQCSRRPLGVLRQGAAEDERHAVRLDAEELGHSLEPVRCEAFGLDPVAQLLETGG